MKTLENFTLYVEPDYDAMSLRAADLLAEEITANPRAVLGLATGSTPLGLYKALVARHRAGLSFAGLTTFNLDEYYPIPRENPQSYHTFMRENFFSQVDIPPGQTHIPDGAAPDPAAECAAYDRLIAQAGGIDLQLLGVGVNGHIGFNEPADVFSRGTHLVTLTASTLAANARFFKNPEQVPRQAVSMGVRTIFSARKILVVLNGPQKAAAAAAMLQGPITPAAPASVLQLHRHVVVVMDEAAAKGL